MRAVASPPLVSWRFLPRHEQMPLIHLRPAPVPASRWPGLAEFPAGWREVPGSRIRSAQQRFATFSRPGMPPVHYHSSHLAGTEPAVRCIARVNLGRWRVSVLPAGNGYEARWQAGDTAHRISGGPAELAPFMDFVLSLALS